ncbi:MAG TPA: PAS domain S-box protein [Planctomycetota bacterium]|nr:PAS domain S-box protein [Planctomycetota bacterium]
MEADRFFVLSLDIMCVASANGYFLRVNPAFSQTLGWTEQELLERPYIEFVHPDDRDATLVEVERQIIAGEKVLKFENRYRHKDGSWRTLSWRSVPQPGGLMYGTARDVTEQRHLEDGLKRQNEILAQMFASLPGLYLVLTPDLKIVGASDAYLKATMTTRDGITGRGLFEVFPDNPEDKSATGTSNLRASLDRVLKFAQSDTMAIQRYDVRNRDGKFEERYWSPINSPVLDSKGTIQYIVHRVEDVTEYIKKKASSEPSDLQARLDKMEAEVYQNAQLLQTANRKLELANRELESFSYSVSHDLRAPLRSIDGFSLALLEDCNDKLDEQGRGHLSRIRAAAGRMGQLIDDLLNLSRITRAELSIKEVDFSAIAEHVIAELRGAEPSRSVHVSIAPNLRVRADERMLRIVADNLVGNAWKFTAQTPAAVIEVGRTEENGEEALFIRDNGAGFDMAYANKLFTPFQRLHGMHEFKGTGIGLATVYRIVSKHGGRLWAKAAVGKGATFFLTLSS